VSEPLAVGGLHELVIGVRSLDDASAYWERFGFRGATLVDLTSVEAEAVYGVSSSARVRYLEHGRSDHGLLRLIEWEKPTGPGLGTRPLRALGSRWGAMLTRSLLAVQSHAESAEEQGLEAFWVSSSRQDPAGPVTRPFLDDLVHVREMILCLPESRQVLFQRFGYSNPSYGAIVESAFPTSQVTHVGVVTAGDPDQVYFHQRTIGALMTREASTSSAKDMASRRIFDLAPNESYRCWDFDDPASSSVPSQWLSGRLKYIHFDDQPVVDLRDASHLGALGHTAYTWRVSDVEAAHRAVAAHGGTSIGEIVDDGSGRRSFHFIDPSGYDWLYLAAS
jgi:Glyoxalase/Bleomycin resistance protein/Dioxygenase superfamily